MCKINDKLKKLDAIGRELSKLYPGCHGSIQFNIKDGRYMGIIETIHNKALSVSQVNK